MKGNGKPSRKMGPGALAGSVEAKRHAAVILEVLSGLRGTEDGSHAMGVSLTRYYLLETRALQGLIGALEPRPKGRQRRPEDEIGALRRDKERLERDLSRTQALVRAAHRSMGIPATPSGGDGSKLQGNGRKRRRVTVRAMRAVTALRTGTEETKPAGRTEGKTETRPSPPGP